MPGFLRESLRDVFSRSTFDFYPGYNPWVGHVPWETPGELIFDEESDIEHSDVGPDNDVYFALTRLVCLQTPHVNPSVVNADKHSY